jgi:hypothetical protein
MWTARSKDWKGGSERKDSMFSPNCQRAWFSTAAVLLTGLTVGCNHMHHHNCSTCDAKSGCTPTVASTPKVELKPATDAADAPGKAMAGATPTPVPLPVNTIPPVSNERYATPERPASDAPTALPTAPVVIAEKPKPDLTPAAPKAETAAATVIPPVGKDFAPRRSFADITAKPEFGHASDYTWLTGELSHIPSKNQWRLRFASIDDEDKYGGSVTLDASLELRGFLSGQLVRVEGEMIDKESRDIAPKYRVKEIIPIKK